MDTNQWFTKFGGAPETRPLSLALGSVSKLNYFVQAQKKLQDTNKTQIFSSMGYIGWIIPVTPIKNGNTSGDSRNKYDPSLLDS